jgi:hypothetical protein
MVKKLVFLAVVLMGFATPRPAFAGCTIDLLDCYGRAARVDSFWYRSAAGLDCEFEFTDCVRRKVTGR